MTRREPLAVGVKYTQRIAGLSLAAMAETSTFGAPEVTYIQKLKRPDGSGLWPAYHTGTDQYGTWLFTPRGSRYRGESGGAVGYCNVGSPVGPGIAVMHLVPVTGWWIATFWDQDGGRWSVTVDVCTPARLAAGTWTYTDLELDIHVEARTGEVLVVDEDEFADACEQGHITADEALAARLATDQVVQLIKDEHEPFAGAGDRMLTRALALALPPVTSFR